jgi:hypothetical protein
MTFYHYLQTYENSHCSLVQSQIILNKMSIQIVAVSNATKKYSFEYLINEFCYLIECSFLDLKIVVEMDFIL